MLHRNKILRKFKNWIFWNIAIRPCFSWFSSGKTLEALEFESFFFKNLVYKNHHAQNCQKRRIPKEFFPGSQIVMTISSFLFTCFYTNHESLAELNSNKFRSEFFCLSFEVSNVSLKSPIFGIMESLFKSIMKQRIDYS